MTELVDGTPTFNAISRLGRYQQELIDLGYEEIERSLRELLAEYEGLSFHGGDVFDTIRQTLDSIEHEAGPIHSPTTRSKLPAAVRQRVFESDEYRCVACGGWTNLTIDHIIAVVNGGSDDEENLQTMCKSCNSRKGAR